MWKRTHSFQPRLSSQHGPNSFGLTMPSPAYWFPPWPRLFRAEERQGCSRPGRDPKNIEGEVPWHFRRPKPSNRWQPFNLFSLYRMAHIWPPLRWPILRRLTAQAPEESLWPGASLYFQVLFRSHSLASKWVQIDKIESFLLGTELGNQITPARPHLLFPTFIRVQSSKMEMFLLQFYDTSTAWLSHFMAIFVIMGLWQMKQIAIKCWENPKSWMSGLLEEWHWGWIQMAWFILLQTVMPALMGANGPHVRMCGDF